jgi:hypothetical protein
MNSIFQPTANCQITICLTQGVHPSRASRVGDHESSFNNPPSSFTSATYIPENFRRRLAVYFPAFNTILDMAAKSIPNSTTFQSVSHVPGPYPHDHPLPPYPVVTRQ